MTKLRFKYLCGKILCKLFRVHTFDILKYKFNINKSENSKISLRVEKCKFCAKKKEIWDGKAEFVLAEKERLWKERRRVTIEKHKNPKEYELRAWLKGAGFDGEDAVFHRKIYYILDEDIDRKKMELLRDTMHLYLRNRDFNVDYICLEEERKEKIPDYVYE